MSGILQGGAADDLDARMAYFVQKQSNDGCFVLDKETEDLVKLETPLGGVTDIVRQSLEFVAAVFRLPVTKFLGISPAGFNPTGEAERRNLYDYLASRQEKILRRPLTQILNLLQLHAFGRIDPDLTFEFVPLNPDDEGGDGNRGEGNGGGNEKKTHELAPLGSSPLTADKNDFKESEHPRDKDGKFAEGNKSYNLGLGPITVTPEPQTKQNEGDQRDLAYAGSNLASSQFGTEKLVPIKANPLSLAAEWLIKLFVKSVAKQSGKRIGRSFFNDTVNASEEMVDVRKGIMEIERKIAAGAATNEDLAKLNKLKKREITLWEEYGDEYLNDEFYRRYFPDNNYAEKCLKEVAVRQKERRLRATRR